MKTSCEMVSSNDPFSEQTRPLKWCLRFQIFGTHRSLISYKKVPGPLFHLGPRPHSSRIHHLISFKMIEADDDDAVFIYERSPPACQSQVILFPTEICRFIWRKFNLLFWRSWRAFIFAYWNQGRSFICFSVAKWFSFYNRLCVMINLGSFWNRRCGLSWLMLKGNAHGWFPLQPHLRYDFDIISNRISASIFIFFDILGVDWEYHWNRRKRTLWFGIWSTLGVWSFWKDRSFLGSRWDFSCFAGMYHVDN